MQFWPLDSLFTSRFEDKQNTQNMMTDIKSDWHKHFTVSTVGSNRALFRFCSVVLGVEVGVGVAVREGVSFVEVSGVDVLAAALAPPGKKNSILSR